MALAQEDFQQIGEFVKDNISLWLAEQSLGKPPVVYEIELRERMVRVEEELKHQRELMREGFERVDKRFEQVDKRFEEMREDMEKRFEQVDKRFEQVDKRFDTMLKRHDHQFIALVALISSGIGLVIVALPFLLRI